MARTAEQPTDGGSDERLRARCACGWEIVGTEDEVVPATIDHGQRVHHMAATREAVLAAAERLGGTVRR